MSIKDPGHDEKILNEHKVQLLDKHPRRNPSCIDAVFELEDPDVDSPLHKSTEQNSGFLNRIFFCFVAQYIWRTRKYKDEGLLEQPIDRFKSKNASQKLTSNWKIAKQRGESFVSVIRKTFGKTVALHGILLFIEEFVHIGQPIFMGILMSFFRPDSTVSWNTALWAAFGVAGTAIISPLIHHPYFHGLLQIGCELKVASTVLLYKKGLTLSSSSLLQTSSGQLINLLSSDLIKFETGFIFVHYIWLSPILLFAYGYVIYLELGVSCVAGFVCLLVLIVVQSVLSFYMGVNRRLIAERADKRLSVMNEIISGIRVIKMYAWEDAFSSLVQKYRDREINRVTISGLCSSAVMGLFFTSGKMAILTAVLFYVYLENELTAEKVFVASALYNSCRFPFSLFLPLGVHLLSELRTTSGRIEKFLGLNEFNRENKDGAKNINTNDFDEQQLREIKETPRWMINTASTNHPSLLLKDLTTVWIDDAEITEEGESKDASTTYGIKNVDLKINDKGCIGIVGQVGSGKSSLLSSILGEAKITSGSLDVYGKIAYCTQEPWIFPGTVRENILFCNQFDMDKYSKTVDLCLLSQDFKQLVDGDMTEVGDRGSTLSGGQRARVALARAIYSDADIYLFDDPLSAVDSNVGKLLYKRIINGLLKDKIVILVTHQIQHLEDLPRVLLMKDGFVIGEGTVTQLKKQFSELFVSLEEETLKEGITEEKYTARSVSRQSAKRTLSSSSEKALTGSCRNISLSDNADALSKLIEDELNEFVAPKLRNDEEKSTGTVSYAIYWAYIKEICNPRINGFFLAIFVILTQLLFNFADWWLSKWTTAAERWTLLKNNGSMDNFEDSYNILGYQWKIDFNDYMYTYTYVTIIMVVFGVIRCMWFRYSQIGASRRFHNKMFEAVVNTNISFFDSNSVGRILNRFSKDISVVDDQIAFVFFEYVLGILAFGGIVIVIVAINPSVFIPTAPIIIAFGVVRQVYISRSRELKRLEAITRSPMNTHVTATLNGLPTIRAFGKESEMLAKFYEYQDMNMAAYNMSLVSSRWFAVAIDYLVALFIGGVALLSIFQYENMSSGEVALTLMYAVQLTGFFSWVMRQSAELQNGMVAVERIVEYTKLKSEHELRKLNGHFQDELLGENWPSAGQIDFSNVCAHYGTEQVLSNLNFTILPKQKIGIAGRTGAGKSTLLKVLFGLKEISNGKLLIDNVDVETISLKYRRKGMAIIPQEPVLFLGTVRNNLDPFDEYSDELLWDALEQCELKDTVSEMGGLGTKMQEGGTNFSVGQRQLVCLARAIIHHAKILVIDEATANVDARTDSVIQKTIRNRFAESTVLTIAHRLNTIMESDRIMVFQSGELIEFETPKALMDDTNSALWNLALQSGTDNAMQLRRIANETYKLNKKKSVQN